MIEPLSILIAASGFGARTANLMAIGIICLAMLLSAALFYIITKYYVTRIIKKKLSNFPWAKLLLKHDFFTKLSYSVPLVMGYSMLYMLDSQDFPVADLIFRIAEKILSSLIILNLTMIAAILLNVAGDFYQDIIVLTKDKPIKSYVQVAKIILWMVSTFMLISNLCGISPLSMLTGLGAISAVLMLVFRDIILGFISSITISAYDIVRIGDRVTFKNYDIDGIVIDIALNVVRIKGSDNTIATIPTQGLIDKGVINWREMEKSGGRRIQKSLHIDMSVIRFCDKQLLDKISKIPLLSPKVKQLLKSSKGAEKGEFTETNMSLYREYVHHYLQTREDLHANTTFPLLVRVLQPTPQGLPLEIYTFTTITEWSEHERIQAEIMEHLVAVLTFFELKVHTG
jgi:miniconductance mechanosensitive channel